MAVFDTLTRPCHVSPRGRMPCRALAGFLILGLLACCLSGCSGRPARPEATNRSTLPDPADPTGQSSVASGRRKAADSPAAPALDPSAAGGENTEQTGEESDAAAAESPANGEPPAADTSVPTAGGSPEVSAAAEDAEQEPAGTKRILLLAPAGPLLVELRLRIDGEALDAPLERLVDEILRAADTNGDGVPTWDELTSSPRFRYGQFGNQPINSMDQQLEVRRNYDAGDGRVDRYEVLRYINANQAGGGAFTLSSSNQFREDNQTRSPVLRLLDEDEDGRLSLQEIEAAPVRLRSRDNDENDILYGDDFKIASNLAARLPGGAMARRSKRYGPDAAVVVDERTDFSTLLVSLQELYAYGGEVGADVFSLVPAMFEGLDADGNGVLEAGELARLIEVAPHVKIAARFGTPPDAVTDRLELLAIHDALQSRASGISRTPGRIAITLPDVEILLVLSDAVPAMDGQQLAQAQLMQLDADGNGYLDEEEFSAEGGPQPLPFAAVDADGDGKVFASELGEILRRRQAAARSQLRAYAADQEDALFHALDSNNDGRLTTREIDGAPARLQALDRNTDGQLTAYEIPGSMLITLSRGGPAMTDGSAIPPVPQPDVEQWPSWFRQMDTNRDGDVSRLEFLGDNEKFSRLDADSDGFIDGHEATRKDL